MTSPDHRHIPIPLDRITGITADLAHLDNTRARTERTRTGAGDRIL